MDGCRRRRRTDDYLDGDDYLDRRSVTPPWEDYSNMPQPLSWYDYFRYIEATNIPLWNGYFLRPPSDESARRYYVASNKRARVADDDATLRWQLPEVAPRSGKDDECGICLQHLASSSREEKEETTRAMPCSHVFHERCIFQWLRHKRTCPLCRRTLPTPQEQEYDYHDDDRLQLTMPVPREMLQIEVL